MLGARPPRRGLSARQRLRRDLGDRPPGRARRSRRRSGRSGGAGAASSCRCCRRTGRWWCSESTQRAVRGGAARSSTHRDVERVVCATDAGREGELIFRYIYEAAGCRKPFSRLWISSLTPDAIRKGFSRLRDGRELRPAGRRRPRPQPRRLAGRHEPLARLHARLRRGAVGGPRADADARDGGRARAGDPRLRARGLPGGGRDLLAAERETAYRGTWFRGDEPTPEAKRLKAGGQARPGIRGGGARSSSGRRPARPRSSRSAPRRSGCRRRCSTTSPSCSATPTASTASAPSGRSGSRRRCTSRRSCISYPRTDSRHLSQDVAATLRRDRARHPGAVPRAARSRHRRAPARQALRRRRQGHRPPRHPPHDDLAGGGRALPGRAEDLRPDLPPAALRLARATTSGRSRP